MGARCRLGLVSLLAMIVVCLFGLCSSLGPRFGAGAPVAAEAPHLALPAHDGATHNALQQAATVQGAVTDGSGHGWPLYARVAIRSSEGYSTTVFTDPFTGLYAASLSAGVPYSVAVSAELGGYRTWRGEITPPPGESTQNWSLAIDPAACTAPGYGPSFIYWQDLHFDDGGFKVSGRNPSWEWGAPTSGPSRAHTGANVWATRLSGAYDNDEDGYLTSPAIDLSAYTGQTLILSWWQWLETEGCCDDATVQVSADDGATWTSLYGPTGGSLNLEWTRQAVWLEPAYAVPRFRLRFRFYSDYSVVYPGWYLDDIGILVPTVMPYYAEDLEADNGGYTVSGRSSWAWGAPSGTPATAHSGRNVWATNLSGEYGSNEDGYLTSPAIDMSAYAGQSLTLSWWQVLILEAQYDQATVEASPDNGATWQVVYGPVSGLVDASWAQHEVYLDARYAAPNVRVRFHLFSDTSITKAGVAIDDIKIEPYWNMPLLPCDPQPGGLVVGLVRDGNTGAGLPGALVQDDGGQSSMSIATRDDAALDDGLYGLFAATGDRTVTAQLNKRYGQDTRTVAVAEDRIARLDLALPAGRLSAAPAQVEVKLDAGTQGTAQFRLTNVGSRVASFSLFAHSAVLPSMGQLDTSPRSVDRSARSVDRSARSVDGKQQVAPDTRALNQPAAAAMPNEVAAPNEEAAPDDAPAALPCPPAPEAKSALKAATVLRQWPTGLSSSWGIAYDPQPPSVWVGSPSPEWYGDNTLYEFTLDGERTGREHAFAWTPYYGPADLAYDWTTGMLWAMHVGDYDNCIYEMDPASGYTGRQICPGGSGFSHSQRGLAFDPATDTFFAGSWNDGIIYRFDRSGAILEQVYVGLEIAGLAYNPTTRHLLVTENGGSSDLSILDVSNGYAVLEQMQVPGFSYYSGAGLEIDCEGYLWAIDSETEIVYQLDVGEEVPPFCEPGWVTVTPPSGTLAAGSGALISVMMDASTPETQRPGWHEAHLRVYSDTPYALSVPIRLFVNPPATWGQVQGQVTGLGYCDLGSTPISGATVLARGSGEATWSARTDAEGRYELWLDAALGPLTLTISHAGYADRVLDGVPVVAGGSTTRDASLRPLEPCFQVEPTEIELSLGDEGRATVPLTLSNAGAGSLSFQLGQRSARVAIYTLCPDTYYFAGGCLSQWGVYQQILETDPLGRFEVTLLDRLDAASLAGQDVLLLPDSVVPEADLEAVAAWFSAGRRIVAVDSAICYAAYSGFMWPDAAGSNGVDWLWNYDSGCGNQLVLQTDDITAGYEPGAILGSSCGCAQMLSEYLPADARTHTARVDAPNRIYVASRAVPGRGTIVVLGPYIEPEENLDRLIRNAVGGPGAPDVPWIHLPILSGTVAPDGVEVVPVVISRAPLDMGVYDASLTIWSNDRQWPSVEVPVHLTVTTELKKTFMPLVWR